MRALDDVVRRVITVTGLACVQIVTAHLTEENLAFHSESALSGRGAAGGDQSRDHLELGA